MICVVDGILVVTSDVMPIKMTEKEELENAEKVFFTRNIPFFEGIKALDTIHRILKKCGIEPQTGKSAVLRQRITQAMKILDEEEAQK